MDILDNLSQIAQKDTKNALGMAANEPRQLVENLVVENQPKRIPQFTQIVVTGMGGSALAAELARDWLDLPLPLVVVKDYVLPHFVGPDTLVIACSFSGNTEETLSAFEDAKQRKAHLVIAAGKGSLMDAALKERLPFVHMPYDGVTPRMFMLENLRAFLEIFIAYNILDKKVLNELEATSQHLQDIDAQWGPKVPFENNPAKQLAWHCAGKTAVIYAGPRFRSIAYKWKISINESAKNTAFCHEYSEFNHNEFMGWASHPIDKPFAVIDLRSSFDLPQIQRRFELSDKLLSGLRPKAKNVELEGETMLEQMVWGIVFADYVSTYLGILNGVDPAPVPLIEKLKKELAKP
jgi:glucose/mannose-6-phosphate isomerase